MSRTLLLSGDFFLGGVVAAALTKLLLRLRKGLADSHELHRATAEAMLVIAAMLRLGENPLMAHPIDADSGELLVQRKSASNCRVKPASLGEPLVAATLIVRF